MADGPDDADENVINLADRLKEKNKNRARKPRHKREMPEDDERSQSGCEMRDGGANPGLYLISGLGVRLSQHFKVLATCDAYEADGIARRRGVLRSIDETPPIRTNLLSNGERDIAEILKRAKLEVPGGIVVRVPGVAAIGRGKIAGEPGASLDVSSTHWRAFIKEAVRVLRGPGYGVAGPLFIRILIERKIGGERVGNLIDGFVKRLGADEMHPQVARVAMKAGLVAAAGEMAIDFGILPWPVGSAIDAAEYVFQEWLKRRGTKGSHELMEALRKIQALFEQSGTSRFDPLHTVTQADLTDPLPGERPPAGPIDPNDPPLTTHTGGRAPASRRLGWVAGLGEKQRWYIAEQTWKDEVGKLYDVRAINSVLEKKGALEFEKQTNCEKPRNRLRRIMINGRRYPFYVVTPEILQVASDPLRRAWMLNSLPGLLSENGGQADKFWKFLVNQALNRGSVAGNWRAVAGKSPI